MRRATSADARAISALIAAVSEEGRWLGTRAPVDVAERTARLAPALADGRTVSFVAERGGAVVGEASLFLYGQSTALGMCLAPEVRGRGLGGALLDRALRAATDLGRPVITLDVYAHNVAARRLYASRGFTVTDETGTDDRGDGVVYRVIAMERRAGGG